MRKWPGRDLGEFPKPVTPAENEIPSEMVIKILMTNQAVCCFNSDFIRAVLILQKNKRKAQSSYLLSHHY